MISKTNVMKLLRKNLERTEMLIAAMEKIKAYNQIYQNKQTNLELLNTIKSVQGRELTQIEQSCAEHAIISLVTAFETYYKELIQELLSDHEKYFISRQTTYSAKVNELFKDSYILTYEEIQDRLNLNNRFKYYQFFQEYSIVLFSNEDKEIIEHLYVRRNNYVHNAGRLDEKSKAKLEKNPSPFPNVALSTEAKRLRTKLSKLLFISYEHVISTVNTI